MERIEYRDVVDKSKWARGPWDNEPDKIQWKDEATGLPCLIVRSHVSGNLCGYVGVSSNHPLYEKRYQDQDLEVHGGLSYADKCMDGAPESDGICHIPGDGEPDHVWWFGFDCAHCFDKTPAIMRYLPEFTSKHGITVTYRDVPYVENECRELAKQLKALE